MFDAGDVSNEDGYMTSDLNTTPNHSMNQNESSPAVARAVHQCSVCNKIFVSFKGLQQHAVIHTDQKPFVCDICGKAFRFKSNLFEHRSVHSGFTPHQCPYCGKTCRLKGNLKKHLKTHVNTPDELQDAWKPFASNRRPPMQIPDDAIVVRSTGEPIYHPPTRPRKKKLGLGADPSGWIEKIRKGEILPPMQLSETLEKLNDLLTDAEQKFASLKEVFDTMRAIPLERFDCPSCTSVFVSRREAVEHMKVEHEHSRTDNLCTICLIQFSDKKQFELHNEHHLKVKDLIEKGLIPDAKDPLALSVDECLMRVEKRARGEIVESDRKIDQVCQPSPAEHDLSHQSNQSSQSNGHNLFSVTAPPHLLDNSLVNQMNSQMSGYGL